MKRTSYDILTVDVLNRFFDGKLDREACREIEALKVRDDEFRHLMVDFEDNRRLKEFLVESSDNEDESRELLEKLNEVIHRINANEGKHIRRGTFVVVALSLFTLLLLFASLLHVRDPRRVITLRDTHIKDCQMIADGKDKWAQIVRIDSVIEQKRQSLPRYGFMERYLPKEQRMRCDTIRSCLYEMNWQKLQLLNEVRDIRRLRPLLREYVLVDGRHRNEAKHRYSKYLKPKGGNN